MKKKVLLLVCVVFYSMGISAADFENAKNAVKNMGVGWNLGNTLEANQQTIDGKKVTDFTKDDYWGRQGLESETCWGQPYTKPELLKMMKEAGFGAIRVPVTWYNHMDKDGKVKVEWMKRVHEVVDYVIDNGMYCIINMHHDTGADSDGFHSWIKADEDNYNSNKTKYENLWKQIAEEFKDYDEHLLFESYNEMLDKISSWCFASFASAAKYDEAIATSAYNAINSYAQSFVTTVRATGGNNANRNLVVNTYAACCGSGTWSNHLKDPLSRLTIPTDDAKDHLIVQVHDYPNIESGINNAIAEFDDMVAAWNTNILSKGIPMILGEWSTSNVDAGAGKTDYDVRKDIFFQFVEHVVKTCKENDVATFYWMGLTDGASRSLPAFNQPDLAEQLIKSYYGSTADFKYPTEADFQIQYTVNFVDGWSELFLYGNWNTITPLKLTEYKGVRIEMVEEPAANSLQIKVYGDSDGKSADGSTKFKEDYYPLATGTTTTTVTFDKAKTGSTVSRLTLQTNAGALTAKINKVALIKSDDSEVALTPTVARGCTLTAEAKPRETSIGNIPVFKQNGNNAIYTLSGQQVKNPQKGIYIQNGKKYVRK